MKCFEKIYEVFKNKECTGKKNLKKWSEIDVKEFERKGNIPAAPHKYLLYYMTWNVIDNFFERWGYDITIEKRKK